jgi:hypothetical protein
MAGSVKLGLAWNSPDASSLENHLLEAQGTLETSPVQLATNTGGTLNEPAWKGSFDAQLLLQHGLPHSLNSARLTLAASSEQLRFELRQALALNAAAGTAEPAAFAVDLRTDLASCTRRGNVWLTEPPQMSVGGQLQLAVNGVLDLAHIEVLNANWGCEPLVISTPQLTLSEPKLIGKFGGRVDTSDLTRLIVDVLQVQSTSFSIGAEDQAKPGDDASRVGQAMWRVDLARLMRNVGSESNVTIDPSLPAASKISATGMLQGQLAWEVSPQAAGFNTRIDGQDIVVLSQAAGTNNSPTANSAITSTQQSSSPATRTDVIWQEPSLVANLAGTWVAATGAIDLPKCQLQAPWLNYDGKLTYRAIETPRDTAHSPGQTSGDASASPGPTGSEAVDQPLFALEMNGQMVYDAAQLSAKLKPYTGDQVQLSGQQSVPVHVSWRGGQDPQESLLTGLNLATRLGWEQGSVAGIPLGKADVPITIDAGQLLSSAEIPVSGGALRWDLSSNLAAAEWLILQQPMQVLDNVQITDPMCKSWLKYVAPLLAEATSVDGRLSLRVDKAALNPVEPIKQNVAGQVIIHNATVGPGPLSNQVILLAKQIEAVRKQDPTRMVSNTQKVWLNMPEQTIDFEMIDGRVAHRNLHVKVGDATIATNGSVRLDGQMEMQATLPIPDDWADKSPWLAGLRGQSLQFPVRGTLSNPQIDSQLLTQLSEQTVRSTADNLLRQGLNRGLDKLLGGQDNNTGSEAGNSNPLQGLGDQILKGQFPKGQGLQIPGIFPGFGGQPPSTPKWLGSDDDNRAKDKFAFSDTSR